MTEETLAHEFNELSEELSLLGPDGVPCMVKEHGHNDKNESHANETDKTILEAPLNLTCESSFQFIEQLLLRLNLTSDCCLVNGTVCKVTAGSGSQKTGVAQGTHNQPLSRSMS